MQNIRSKNTTPEIYIMNNLRKQNIYFAKHVDTLPGKPDIVFRKKRVAVFIDSDFWHGNPKYFIMPKANIKYWREKIKMNRERDKSINSQLKQKGWKVIRLWEHDIKNDVDRCTKKIFNKINISL